MRQRRNYDLIRKYFEENDNLKVTYQNIRMLLEQYLEVNLKL